METKEGSQLFSELLWIYSQLPDEYVVLDTETTGLPDETGYPDIIKLCISVVCAKECVKSYEYSIRPSKSISEEAGSVHGITDEMAAEFETFQFQWPQMSENLNGRIVVIHNASFDWPILVDHINRYKLSDPIVKGVFCSQKAAIPWALAMGIECSCRGPSLDKLTKALGLESLRARNRWVHGALIDSEQTVSVVERLRSLFIEGSSESV